MAVLQSNLTLERGGEGTLHSRLKKRLRDELEQHFQPNQRFHSVRELTRLHGVSTTTATRTLRELVADGYLYGRQRQGMFVRPKGRRRVKPVEQVFTLSLPLPQPLDEVLLQPDSVLKDYLRGIADAGREGGAAVELQFVPFSRHMEFNRALIEREAPTGVILYGWKGPEFLPLLERAIERAIPYVVVQPERALSWEEIERLKLNYVTIDQQAGIRSATVHLADLGHRHIAYWQHPRTAPARLTGYLQGMVAAGLSVDEAGINRDFDFDVSCISALRGLIDHGVTALVTASDFIAMQVLKEAAASGIDIPDRLSVTGFDDNPVAGSQRPPLTTVAVDRYRTGREAALSLIQQYQHPNAGKRYQVSTPTKLVVRRSTTMISNSQGSHTSGGSI